MRISDWSSDVCSSDLLMLVPTSSAYALAQSWESLAAAEGAYRRLSILRIVQAAIVLGIQVSVGLLQPSVEGLALAVMMVIALTLTWSAWFFPLRLPPVGTRRTLLDDFWQPQRQLQMFALPSAPLNPVSAQLPGPLLTSPLGTAYV